MKYRASASASARPGFGLQLGVSECVTFNSVHCGFFICKMGITILLSALGCCRV